MPSLIDPKAPAPSVEEALLEKIEELSLLRTLNDRLVRAPDYASACQVLVDVVWEGCRADDVFYLSVDPQRGLCRVEAQAPGPPHEDAANELPLETEPLPELLRGIEPTVIKGAPIRSRKHAYRIGKGTDHLKKRHGRKS